MEEGGEGALAAAGGSPAGSEYAPAGGVELVDANVLGEQPAAPKVGATEEKADGEELGVR